jgi:ABC-type multidrug transport system fused ATPase/permease subunit
MQRIGIARALYRKPTLIILDEATNSLDSETENQVIGALDRLRGSVTIILIAHSMKTIQNVDKVIFLEEGALAGFDTFEKLRTDSKKFDDLVKSGELFKESG